MYLDDRHVQTIMVMTVPTNKLYEKDKQKIVVKKTYAGFRSQATCLLQNLYRMLAEGTKNVIRPKIYVSHSSVNFGGMWRIYKS
jgi:hypothetical protein